MFTALCAVLLSCLATCSAASPSPSWLAQGPYDNPSSGGIGSVNSIAASADFSAIYIGGNNGGVWKTTDPLLNKAYPDASHPNWIPLSDSNLCNAVAHVTVSNDDPDFVSYVCGGVSSYGKMSGPLIGVYVSHDGGLTWKLPAQFPMGFDMTHVVVTGSPKYGNGTIVASAKGQLVPQSGGKGYNLSTSLGGIFISMDSGATFMFSEDPLVIEVSIRDLKLDLTQTGRVLAATFTGNLLLSPNFGLNWTEVSLPAINVSPPVGVITNAKIATRRFNGGSVPSLVVFMVCDGNQNGAILWSDNGKYMDWSQNAIPNDVADYSGIWFFAIEIDPSMPNIIYIAGGVDSLYRGDLTQSGSSMWIQLGANSPHADHRYLLANPISSSLLITTDGGVWSYPSPNAGTGSMWFPQNGNLQITEFDSVSYNPEYTTIVSGAQDNGCFMTYQNTTSPYDFNRFQNLPSGDGQTTAINNAVSPPVIYYSGQNLGGLASFAWNGAISGGGDINAAVNNPPFYSHVTLNRVKPTLMMTCSDGDGFTGTCYSLDFQGNPLNLNPATTTLVQNIAPTDYVYGGFKNGEGDVSVVFGVASNERVYAADSKGVNFYTSNQVFVLRDWIGIDYAGQSIMTQMRLGANPNDYYEVVVTGPTDVWRTTDFGVSFQSIRGNLIDVINSNRGPFYPDPVIWGVAFIPMKSFTTAHPELASAVIVIGTSLGIYAAWNNQASFEWTLIGVDYPNVVTNTLVYNADADLLVSATVGRGWFTLPHASIVVAEALNERVTF